MEVIATVRWSYTTEESSSLFPERTMLQRFRFLVLKITSLPILGGDQPCCDHLVSTHNQRA